ncbi:asparagine-rich protein [Cryptosporidium xiaoi]|uniref:Asparagine-rich protein n=1 Tax=Cryptosporidium xiaoi TaxID=659607 RepID=A0AAV9Y3W3_9CRYT
MVVEKHQERIINDKKRKFRRPYQKSLNGVQKGKDKGQNNGSLNDSNSISNNKNEGYTVKDVAIVDNSINDLSDNLDSKKDTSSFEVGQNDATEQNYNNKDNINANNSANNRSQTNNNNAINSDNSRNRGRNSQNRNKNDKNYQLSNSSHTRQANNKVQHNNKQAYTQYVNNSSNNYNNNNNSGNSYYNHNHNHNYHRNNSNSGNINNNNSINQSQYYIRNDRFNQDKRSTNSKMYYYQPNNKKYYYNNNNTDYRKQVNNTNNNTAGSTATQTQNRQQNYKNAQHYNNSQFKNSRTQDQQSTASTKDIGGEKNVSSIPCAKETIIDDGKNSSCDIETVNVNSDNSCDVLNDDSINGGADLDKDLGVGDTDNQTRRDSDLQAVGGSKYKNNNANTSGKVNNNKVIYNGNKNKDDYKSFMGKEHSSNKPLNIARNECEAKTPDSNEDRKPKQQLNNSEQRVKNKRDSNGGFNYRGSGSNSTQYYNNYYYYNSNRNFGSGNNTNNSWKGANQSYHKQNYRYNNVKTYSKYGNNGYYNSNNNNNYGSNAIYSKQVNNSNSVNKYQGEFESSYSVESNRNYNNPASYDDYKNKKSKRRYRSGGRDNSIISNNGTNNGGENNYDLTNECKDLKDEINESGKDDTNRDNDAASEANDDIGNSGDNFALNEEDEGVSVVGENGSNDDTVDNKSCIGLFDKKESKTDASLGSTVNKGTSSTVAQNKGEGYVSGAIDEGKDVIGSDSKNTTSLDSNGNNANGNCNEGNDNGAGCGYVSGSGNQTLGSGIGLWRRTNQGNQVVDSLETVRRTVKSLLNKITVEKFPVIAEKLAVCIDNISNVDELEELVRQVLDKAITEPDFSEMYADLCQILKWRSPILIKENSVTMGFGKALLLKCEHEFKNLPRNMTPTDEEREAYDSEEIEIICRKRKLHVLGIIRLIGELFIRRMFPMRSLNELVFDLVMTQEKPDEYAIECLCQLIMTTGYYLDSNEKSQMIVDQWFGRLKELQRTQISARLNCLIQDVFDLRKHKWVKKVHKQKAKALADIMKDIDVEDVLGGAAIAAQYGSVVVVGERSNLVGNSAYNSYMTSQEELYISKQKNQQR